LDSRKDLEKEENVEEVDTTSSVAGSRSSGESERRGGGGGGDRRRIIRFEDGDLENPNNCKLKYSVLI
jgi:hypothetical protein